MKKTLMEPDIYIFPFVPQVLSLVYFRQSARSGCQETWGVAPIPPISKTRNAIHKCQCPHHRGTATQIILEAIIVHEHIKAIDIIEPALLPKHNDPHLQIIEQCRDDLFLCLLMPMATMKENSRPDHALFALEQLAISYDTDPFGKSHMTIELDVHPIFGVANCKAIFDKESQRWKLVTSSWAKLADGQTPNNKVTNNRHHPRRNSDLSQWFNNIPKTAYNEFFLNGVDWSETILGPLEDWPTSLQTVVNMVLCDSQPAVVYWGPEKVAVYNKQMLDFVSARLRKPHEAIGKPFCEIWPELWPDFEPFFQKVSDSETALDTLVLNLFPDRGTFIEETFWNGQFIPIRGRHGETIGFYNRARETTKEFVQQRWTKTLNAITAPCTDACNSIWEYVFQILRENERDFPMAFAYSAEDDPPNSKCTLSLKQKLGLPSDGHPLVPDQVDLYEGTTGWVPYYRKAKAETRTIVLHASENTLPQELLDGFRWVGFGERSRNVAVIPISATNRLLGLLVIGLNPRRPFDEDYDGFLKIFSQQVSATIATALDMEEYQRRAARLKSELENSEKQIRDLAEYGPVGILSVAPNGRIVWANPQFYEITGHPRDAGEHYELSFLDIIDPIDQDKAANLWHSLLEDHQLVNESIRLKRKWKPPPGPENVDSEEEGMFVLANAFPVIENGEVTSVRAAVTDISVYKWAEAVQSRIATAAKEAKRLQENFIDIVSHEMRNPLSAITQLADGISSSLEEFDLVKPTLESCKSIVESNAESGNTILLCAAHQKRIIDDVLTLSKLDSMMLSITPVAVQPCMIVDSALQMFKAEFDTNSISIESSLDETYSECSINWVYLDPSRLTQVFINLISNAIKFTKLESRRQIRVQTAASLERPMSSPGMTWFPTHKQRQDLTQSPEWGEGEEVYIRFEVADTGRGLEQEETARLFNRFQQATAKTHIKYGGSGLGLFISRELTETQGGEIGVVSKSGKGSNFAFYVKGRRAEPPTEPVKFLAALDGVKSLRRRSHNEPILAPVLGLEPTLPSKTCILLVEDNLVNAQVLTKQLEKAGCEVHLANHGMEALECLARSKSWKDLCDDEAAVEFDCILMDVEMPVMDGLTATRRIRQLEKEGVLSKHLNIIAITANARAEQLQQTQQAGADAVQPKPFRVGELLNKIELVRSRKT